MIRLVTLLAIAAALCWAAPPATAQLLDRTYAPRAVQTPDEVDGRICDAIIEIEAIEARLKRRKPAQRYLAHLRALRVRLKQLREALLAAPTDASGARLIQAELLLPVLTDAEEQLNQARLQINASRGRWVEFVAERRPTINRGLIALRVAIGSHPTTEEDGVTTTCAACPTDQPKAGATCAPAATPCACPYADGARRETICACPDGRWLCSNHMSERGRSRPAP